MTQIFNRSVRAAGLLALGLALGTAGAEAGCNCGGGSGGVMMGPAPMPHYEPMSQFGAGIDSPQMMGLPQGMYGGAIPNVSIPTPDVAPPPGTLGQTYLRPTRPIPVDKHPRVSIIDVRSNGATQVKVYGTNEFRTKDAITGFQDRRDGSVWRFESEPLVPGVPHIYRVDAHYGETVQHRYVRLVPGRIVTLDF